MTASLTTASLTAALIVHRYPALIVEHRPSAPEMRFVIHFEQDGEEIEADLPDDTVQLLAGRTSCCEGPACCTEHGPEGRKLLARCLTLRRRSGLSPRVNL